MRTEILIDLGRPDEPCCNERHYGLGNVLIAGAPARSTGSIRRRPRLGGLLNYYERAA
jgi:hypothetical protein